VTPVTKTDREQIEELTAIYADALDRKDYSAVRDCFTPDAVVSYAGYSRELRGQPAIVQHMRLALQPLDATQHFFANFMIEIEGNAACLACDVLAQHVRRGFPDGETFLAGGKYHAELAKSEGRWRFSRIAARTQWSDGNRDLLPRVE
jgi:ketosteroid isomerase-like protein